VQAEILFGVRARLSFGQCLLQLPFHPIQCSHRALCAGRGNLINRHRGAACGYTIPVVLEVAGDVLEVPSPIAKLVLVSALHAVPSSLILTANHPNSRFAY